MTRVAPAAALAAMGAVMHLLAGYRVPRPWPDEAHFITPALTLLHDGRLAVPELNAPEGIFWLPHGYYVLQAPLHAVGLDPLVAGRLLSLLGVVTFAVAVAAVAARAGLPRWLATTLAAAWLVTARVVAIGNIARMDAVVLGLAGLSMWLLIVGRRRLAVTAAAVAPLVHPVGLVVLVAVAGAAVLAHPRTPWRRAEVAVAVVVAVLWAAQVGYFLANAGIAGDHLAFQLSRKAGRTITVAWWQWLLLASAGVAGAAATLRWRRATAEQAALWCALALAGAFVLVDVVGREMWYQPLGRETAILLLGVVGLTVVRKRTGVAPVHVAAAAAAVVLAAVGLRPALTGTWYAMRLDPASRGEWTAFTRAAMAQLHELDRTTAAPLTVLVDPYSGLGQHLTAQRWQGLQFVQPTPATPAGDLAADYLLTTPGAPFSTRSLVAAWQGGAQTRVRSSRGTYEMILLEAR